MKIDTQKSAVVLIEFQNQWTDKGLYHWLIKNQLTSRNVMKNTRALVDTARKKGIKIIHAPLIIDPENKKGWIAWLTFGKVFAKGTWNAGITKGLFKEGDILVTGRYAFDAFVGSDLEQVIADNDIETLLICGFTTDQCIAKTMRTAIKKGIDSYLVSDCTATMNGFFQWKTERKYHGKVVNHLKAIDWLSHM